MLEETLLQAIHLHTSTNKNNMHFNQKIFWFPKQKPSFRVSPASPPRLWSLRDDERFVEGAKRLLGDFDERKAKWASAVGFWGVEPGEPFSF